MLFVLLVCFVCLVDVFVLLVFCFVLLVCLSLLVGVVCVGDAFYLSRCPVLHVCVQCSVCQHGFVFIGVFVSLLYLLVVLPVCSVCMDVFWVNSVMCYFFISCDFVVL